jgi:diadenosine tetraphosphatase ApaH/serine/threonine PP2A family protein phosphatase
MRYAIFGDIHANWEALTAVMADAQELECTHYVCLGDIVGYNANPSECLDYVRALNCPVVKGNHDEEATKERALDELNPLAESALLWTRQRLTEDQKQWLRELKLVRQVRDFTIVHATLDSPGSWAYISNRFDAMASFSYQFTQLCFYGHTHSPRIYEKDDTVRCLRDTDMQFRKGVKYFINVGSVGQPRDGDWRASYAVYDVEQQEISIRRLEYDIRTAQEKIRDSGLPPVLADRLAVGR